MDMTGPRRGGSDSPFVVVCWVDGIEVGAGNGDSA